MENDENKALICEKLAETLKLTREFGDITDIVLDDKQEIATVRFDGELCVDVNVNWDSGIALILDILKAISR